MLKSLKFLAFLGFVLAAQATAGQAITVAFDGPHGNPNQPYFEDGFSLTPARIVNGNCATDPCLALNKNELTKLARVGGGLFSLNSFWVQTLGQPSELTIKTFLNNVLQQTFLIQVPHNNGGVTITQLFAGITSITFKDTGRGNLRIDDLNLSTPQVNSVPLPAGLPLLLAGLAALGVGRRWTKKAL